MEKTRKSSRLLTQGFAVFMLLTTLMSGAALLRMSERSQDLPPQNRFEQYLDQHYSPIRPVSCGQITEINLSKISRRIRLCHFARSDLPADF